MEWFERKDTIIICIVITLIIAISLALNSNEGNESYGNKSIKVSNYIDVCRSRCHTKSDTSMINLLEEEFNKAQTEEDLDTVFIMAYEYFQ